MTPQEWLDKIKKHNEENPSHGIGCVCMDESIREFRAMFPMPKPPYGDDHFTEWLNGPEMKFRQQVFRAIQIGVNGMDR
jgi:hypothetical protein